MEGEEMPRCHLIVPWEQQIRSCRTMNHHPVLLGEFPAQQLRGWSCWIHRPASLSHINL